MSFAAFRRAGHWPTLFCAFLYFDISFMVWVMVGALGNAIAADFELNDAQKGFLVAIPILGGAVLRLVLGWMTDRMGGRRTGLIGLGLTLLPLLLGWVWADSFGRLLFVGVMLGIAGASFAAALPMASRWYPPQYQGLVLGIAGAGNSGTALATLFGPILAAQFGWHAVFGLAMIPVALALLVLFLFARESPSRPPPQSWRAYAQVSYRAETWWFCAFYAVTFGGFVGLASFLNIFFREQFAISPASTGAFTTACVVSGAFFRPVGGYLADRIGGARLLVGLFALLGVMMAAMAFSPGLALAAGCLFIVMGTLGMGNGAIFQLVPQRFSRELGVVTGLVGAAGGLGGFFLPNLLGSMRYLSGSFAGGFVILSFVAFASAIAMKHVWTTWLADVAFGDGSEGAQRPADSMGGLVPILKPDAIES